MYQQVSERPSGPEGDSRCVCLGWAGLLQECGATPCPPEWALWGTHGHGWESQAGLLLTVVVAILPASPGPSRLMCIPPPHGGGPVLPGAGWTEQRLPARPGSSFRKNRKRYEGLDIRLLFRNPRRKNEMCAWPGRWGG